MRALLTASLIIPVLVLAQAPAKLGYQGLLLKADGTPETGVVTVHFALFDSATGGTALWQETQQLALSAGLYSTFLGEVTALPANAFDGTERFLELTVEGNVLLPRQRINSVAYSLMAGSARDVAGGTVDATSVKIGGVSVIDDTGKLTGPAAYSAGVGLTLSGTTFSLPTSCGSGEVLRWNGTAWECSTAGASGYQAGAGLALSGTTFSLNSCTSAGEVLKWTGTGWTCQGDADTTYSAASNGGLSLASGAFSIDSTGCTASGQVLKWIGTTWACQNDSINAGTVTQVSTGPGLTGGPISSSGTIDLRLSASGGLSKTLGVGSNELGIATGGVTNSMLAADSVTVATGSGLAGGGSVALGGTVTLNNTGVLSVVGSGAINSSGGQNPVLSLGVVGVLNGGTGLSSGPSAAGEYLRASGAGTWAAGGIQASDLPSLSGSYLDLTSNQTVAGTKTFSSPIAGSVTGSAASFTGGLVGDVTGTQGATVVERLQGRAVATTAPGGGQVLAWNGSAWAPSTPAAGSVGGIFSGRIKSLGAGAGMEFGAATAFSSATTTESDVTTLSPNVGCSARNFSVKLTAAPGAGSSRTFMLRRDQIDTVVTCTIADSATTCNSASGTATIYPANKLSIGMVSFGGPAASDALFGWECH